MTGITSETPNPGTARLAGVLYLITMASAIFSQSYIRGSLIVRDDATQTAQNIIGSERLFRIGVATDVITFAGVLVLTWALYVLLRPVDRNIALLAAFLRLVEVAIHLVATVFGLVALRLLSGAGFLNALDASQLHSFAYLALSTQGAGLNLGFVLLGLGSTAFAYLLLRSGYVPKALAALGVFASLLLAASAIAVIVFPAVAPYQLATFVPMFIYEVTLGLWLLVKGANFTSGSTRAA